MKCNLIWFDLIWLSICPQPSFSFFVSLLFLSRLFGLKDIIIPGNCSFPYDLNINAKHDWPVYVNPGILFLLYITIASVLKTGYHGTPNQVSSLLALNCSFLFNNYVNVHVLRCCISVYLIDKEQKQERKKVLNKEMVELRTWNQQKDNYEDETQVLISQ